MEDSIFWADNIAEEIINRKTYTYSKKSYTLPKKPAVKTSSSLSGVLHIGRLTDIIRGEAVYNALKDAGIGARFIYVAEDMDPLRSIPKGVPESYKQYIGMPVTDIQDPWGCHKTYAEHHISDFFDVLSEYVREEPERFSMRAEYKKGSFKEMVKAVMENAEKVREIIEGFKENPLAKNWSPWQPVCGNCGKIITPQIIGIEDGKVRYVCKDYDFKKYKAIGCNHEGLADPLKDDGKMVWKSEWASQWKRWDVVSEGAGKEYIVPNSAFFVNARIVEDVLDYPAPTPIFYEHITIGGGTKMSASVGNVVYPKDWREVAPVEALRLLFLKRIGKSRDFKWEDVPRLVDELDRLEAVYYGLEKIADPKEEKHLKRLYEIVQTKPIPKKYEPRIPYSLAAMVSQLVRLDDKERLVSVLRRLGYEMAERSEELLYLAEKWGNKYSQQFTLIEKLTPDILKTLDKKQRAALENLADVVDKNYSEPDLNKKIFEIAEKHDLKPPKLFQAIYQVFLNEKKGPRAAPFLLSMEKDFVKKRLKFRG
ncbi:MAG: lysine--tRNA ligase [Candidatus Altiarchaeota archaeon]|nr:lysine--tRNA ligase [Candidatus Altiarchaeota archaeon]